MKVRDLTLSIKEYKGRWTDACEEVCPCRPCYNAHDCGYSQHAGFGKTVWIEHMECATRHSFGCGEKPEPQHKLNKRGRCKQCGVYVEQDKRSGTLQEKGVSKI